MKLYLAGSACLVSATLALSGCGDSESEPDGASCGPGTSNVDGVCVPTNSLSGTGGTGGMPGGTAGDTATAGANPGTGGTIPGCPSDLPGPEMVLIETPTAGHFCIDSIEVTQAQYAEFMAANPVPPAESGDCAYNATYDLDPRLFTPDEAPDERVIMVDWCDARDFCAYAGKRLCGSLAGDPATVESANDPLVSEWYAVCSGFGEDDVPYTHDDLPSCPTVDGFNRCEGTIAGVYDLLGYGGGEWTAECRVGEFGPECLTRGNMDTCLHIPDHFSLIWRKSEGVGSLRCCL